MTRRSKPSGRKPPKKGKRLSKNRSVAQRTLRPSFLIVCGGEQTEPNYFKRFRLKAHVEVVGTRQSPFGVVREAAKLAKKKEYNEVWVVFDRDEFPPEEFNTAINKADQKGFGVAYSNQAFELWYILHFDYHDTAIPREQYQKILSQKLGKEYRKNDPTIYDMLLDKQPEAIKNARRLLESYKPGHNPAKDDPCTTIHLLVEKLNKFSS